MAMAQRNLHTVNGINFLEIKTLTKDNCEFSNECEQCENCKILIYKCEYLNYIDYQQETLLFDQCKICDIKEF